MFELHDTWGDAAAWDDFVLQHPEGRFCHLFNYSETARCYGFRARRICFTHRNAHRNGEIAALLPVTETSSYLYARRLISQPFCEYGGLLIDARLTAGEADALIDSLQRYLAQSAPNAVLEIHGNLGVPPAQRARFAKQNPHALASLPLASGADHIWNKVVKYEVRKAVNQARRADVTVSQECTPALIRRDFYPLYAASMKRLGVPPHKVDYYLDCHEMLGNRMQIFWAIKNSKRIAALLGFNSGARTAIVNTVSDPRSWQYRPNDLLHWDYIRDAIERGCAHFDFGSVRYDGQRLYKSKWGCSLVDQAYWFMATDPRRVRTFDSSSAAMQRFSRLWSRYVPRPVADRFGPTIRRLLAR
jgi:CelD/BcsL family acetyltransferase involved in cellulose biosynthesis